MATRSRRALAAALIVAAMLSPAMARAADDDIAVCLRETGSDDAIIAACTNVIGQGASDGPLFTNRGRAHARKSEYAPAIQDFTQAITLDATLQAAWAGRCVVRMLAGQVQQAVADCTRSLQMYPDDVATLFVRASAYFKLGQYDQAIAGYNAVMKLDADDPQPLYGRGLAQLKKGNTAAGNADIAKATAMAADVAESFKSLTGIAEAQSSGQPPAPNPTSAPDPNPSPTPVLQPSTFQRSCSSIRYAISGGNPAVQASCKRVDGTNKPSTLVLRGISNQNGRLMQGTGASTFHKSCTGMAIAVVGPTVVLAADCKMVDGAAIGASLTLGGIDNINGDLKYHDLIP